MRLMIRAWNVIHGLASKLVSVFERKNPEALLELEKENLRKLVGRFNQGLVSHATLSERLKIQVSTAALETTFNQLRRQLLCWSENRAMPELDARTRYDIGENDCRPQPAKRANDYSTSFEAMLNRSV